MKPKFCLFAFVWLVIFGLLMMLGSCEEIITEYLPGDTVFVDRPVNTLAPTVTTVHDTIFIHTVDTLKVEVIIRDTVIHNVHTTDTLIQVVTKDSIIIKEVEKLVTVYKTVIQKDTIFVTDTLEIEVVQIEQRVLYKDTLYVIAGFRPINSIPDELKPYVIDFYTLAAQYGKEVLGGVLLVSYAKAEDLPGESWTSSSFRHGWDYSQMIIQISEEVPSEQARSCVYREMARLQLKKKYVTDVNKIMSPLFPVTTSITTNHLNELFK